MRIEYFKLIDRIVGLDIDARTIRVEADVPQESTIFEGHFPGHPLMPGVLLTEAMAQASGWLIIALTGFDRMPFLASIKEAKLRSFVGPGACLTIDAKLLHQGSGYVATGAKITLAGKQVCDAELLFRVVPFPSPKFAEMMKEVGKGLGFPAASAPNG